MEWWYQKFLLMILCTKTLGYEDIIVTTAYYNIVGKHFYDHSSDTEKDMSLVKKKEKAFSIYSRYFQHGLKINAPYVFYYNEEDVGVLNKLQKIRNSMFETTWIHHSFDDFRMSCQPDLTPQERVWFEKPQLLYNTYKRFNNVTWYAWIDSGINTYRLYTPPFEKWPQFNLSDRWPNKFIYQDFSGVSDSYEIAATAFLVHRDVMEEFYSTFYELIESCFKPHNECVCNYCFYSRNKRGPDIRCRTEQDVFRVLCETKPGICHTAVDLKPEGYNWGAIVTENYRESHNIGERIKECFHWDGENKRYIWPCPDPLPTYDKAFFHNYNISSNTI